MNAELIPAILDCAIQWRRRSLTTSINSPASQAKPAHLNTGRIVSESTRSSISLGRAQRKAAACDLTPEEWMAIGDAGMRAAYFKRYQAGIRDASLLRCDSSIRIDVIRMASEMGIDPLAYANMCRADKQNLCRRYNNWKKWADVFDLAFEAWESLGRSGQMKLIKSTA